MNFLPNDIIICILSKVPLIEFHSLKCVCKGWKRMIEDIECGLIQLQRYSPSMCRSMDNLVLIRNDNINPRGMFSTYLVNCETSGFRPKVSILKNIMGSSFEIIGSCNGLLCLSDKETRCRIVVMNPLTNQTMWLPKLDLTGHRFRVFSCGFGYITDTNSYKVIVMIQTKHYYWIEVMVFDCRTNNNWRRGGMEYFSFIQSSSKLYSGISLNGSLHWINYDSREIISFDLINEKCTSIQPPRDVTSWCIKDLIVFKGCLCMFLNFTRDGTWWLKIWMMKQYGVEDSWEMVYHQQTGPGSKTYRALAEVEDGKILINSTEITEEVEDCEIVVKVTDTMHLFDPMKKELKTLKCLRRPATSIIYFPTFEWLRF